MPGRGPFRDPPLAGPAGQVQARGSAASSLTRSGRVPLATSATVTSSRISRSLARSAIHTSCSARAAPGSRAARSLPPDVRQRPVHHPDHVGEGDLRRRPGQPVAALGAPLGVHDAASAQLQQDALQELRRDLLRPGDLLGGHRTGPGAVGALGDGREFRSGAEGVVDPGGEAHVGEVSRLVGRPDCRPSAERPRVDGKQPRRHPSGPPGRTDERPPVGTGEVRHDPPHGGGRNAVPERPYAGRECECLAVYGAASNILINTRGALGGKATR